MPKFIDLSGEVFGDLSVIRRDGHIQGHVGWRCTCRLCGSERIYAANNLRSGNSTSCGCARAVTHGMKGTREYRTWQHMKARCTNPKNDNYPLYGERGIRVCKRWMRSFDAFFSDMGPRPPGHTLDRKNNEGDYTKRNCRWATSLVQSRNKRNTKMLKMGGREMILADWSKEFGLPMERVRGRLRSGWSLERALTADANPGLRAASCTL